MEDTYECYKCHEFVTDNRKESGPYSKLGLCIPCLHRIFRQMYGDEEEIVVSSVNLVAGSPVTVDAPPAGKKWCACGCKGTLSAIAKWNYIRGHGPHAQKNSADVLVSSDGHLSAAIIEIQKEITWRETRQKQLEQEVGVNRQKIGLLRQALQSMRLIEGGGTPTTVVSQ